MSGRRESAAPAPRAWILMFVAVCLVAANMRMSIMAVGPLLEDIAADRGVPAAALGGLASVPLVTWGLVSPLAHSLGARIGMSRAITLSLLALAAGTLWRSLPGSPVNLWFGTALIGASLAVGNVLIPAVIKRDFAQRVALVMGIYTALLGGLGSVGAGMVVPIAHLQVGNAELGWRIALACTGALIPIALVVWIVANRRRDRADGSRTTAAYAPVPTPARDDAPVSPLAAVGRRIWRDPLAWLVASYMGSQSAISYIFFTWLAPILTSRGIEPVVAGLATMLFQAIGVVGSMLLPLLFRGRLRRIAPALMPVSMLVAACGIVLLPQAVYLWIVLGGITSGASLSAAITLMAMRARDHQTASALSGMAQSVGYLIAAIGPLLFGWLYGLSGGWTVPLLLLLAAIAAQFASGVAVGKDRYVLDR